MRLGHHITVPRAFITAFASDAAFQATPAGAGGYPATILLLRRGGVPASAGLAMCAADQALDSALFARRAAALVRCSISETRCRRAWHSLAWLPAAVMTGIAARSPLACALRSNAGCRRFAASCCACAGCGSAANACVRSSARVVADFARLRSGSRFVTRALVLAVAAQWIARYAALWLALAALGHPLHFGLVFVAQSVALHAAQWTGVPGGVGGGDVALAGALSPWAPLAVLAPALCCGD